MVMQSLKSHSEYQILKAKLLELCVKSQIPENIIPMKICQLQYSAIYSGMICPGNCCLQVIARSEQKVVDGVDDKSPTSPEQRI